MAKQNIKENITIKETFKKLKYELTEHKNLNNVYNLIDRRSNHYFYTTDSGLKNWVKNELDDYMPAVSKELNPQNAIINVTQNKIIIIEYYSQKSSGSAYVKLFACDFKRKQYIKQFKQLNFNIEYVVVINEWYDAENYKDLRDYIVDSGCKLYIGELKLEEVI